MHVSLTHTLHFDAPIDTVFPLFTPLEEKKWVEGWDATIIFCKTELAREPGTIFCTQHGAMPDITWVLSRYDQQNRVIQYVRFAPGHHVGMIDIVASRNTQVQVTYTLTSLSEAGGQYIREEFSGEQYLHRMQHWQQGITRYLETGTKITGK